MNQTRSIDAARGFLLAGLFAFLGVTLVFAADAPVALYQRTGSPKAVTASKDVFWSQPADLNGSKMSSELIPQLGVESEVANDFSSQADTRVTRVTWWGGPYEWQEGDQELTTFHVYFYDDDACSPGVLIAEFYDVEPTTVLEGDDGLGQPVYRYEAPVSVPILGGETYWVVVQAQYHGSPPQWGRQQAVGTQACETMVRSDYFGYLDWTPASQIAGEAWDASQELEINTPTLEACCDDYGYCELLMPDDCAASGGVAQGEGTDCDPNPCPEPELEACCFPNGLCYLLNDQDCLDATGAPQGPGTSCSPNPCPVTGEACCFTGGICVVFDPELCTESFGDPQGPGTTCDPNPCGDLEACCFEIGYCFAYAAEYCELAGGTSQGPGTVCDPNPCPQPDPRACCFYDGTCELLGPISCTDAGGADQGPETSCDPNPCPPPEPEACCFPDGSCQMLLAGGCISAEGVSAGFGTTCDPNNCSVIIPTEKTSWGRMKILYR